jgi:hypothetical protein
MSKSSSGGCKKKSRKGTGHYAQYNAENCWRKNKLRRLLRHLKQYPEDKQTENAMLNLQRTPPSQYAGRHA